jgi:transcriptional regulator
MYTPAAFAATDTAGLHDLIEAHGFGTLVSAEADGPVATHLPFLVERARGSRGTLVCHMARANPQWRALGGTTCLAIFLGPHGYISPGWYASAPAVPTWNYAAVHAYGHARVIEDESALREIVAKLAARHEAGRPQPWSLDRTPEEFVRGMLRAIVGIEIEIERLEGKHKLGQNRPAADRRGVLAALSASDRPGDRELANYTARHTPIGGQP